MQLKKYIDRLIDRGNIAQNIDGFYLYWPQTGGSLDAECLRAIADALDELNH